MLHVVSTLIFEKFWTTVATARVQGVHRCILYTSLINHRSFVVFASLYVRCAICEAAFDTDMVADRAAGTLSAQT